MGRLTQLLGTMLPSKGTATYPAPTGTKTPYVAPSDQGTLTTGTTPKTPYVAPSPPPLVTQPPFEPPQVYESGPAPSSGPMPSPATLPPVTPTFNTDAAVLMRKRALYAGVALAVVGALGAGAAVVYKKKKLARAA